MSISLYGESKSTSQAEVREFDAGATLVDQQVLGLEVSVKDTLLVQVDQRLEDLESERFNLFFRKRFTLCFKEFFEVVL
jgi:hypothetical protein